MSIYWAAGFIAIPIFTVAGFEIWWSVRRATLRKGGGINGRH